MFRNANTISSKPTVFHLTHHKAGSQWVSEILKRSDPARYVASKPLTQHLKDPTVYQTKDEFELLLAEGEFTEPYSAFYVKRDLRDTLVSLYFSLKYSHAVVSDNVRKQRANLENLNDLEGMRYLLEHNLQRQSNMQMSWINENITVFKYEDLLKDELAIFMKIKELAELDIADTAFKTIVKDNSFQNISGRKQGEEDQSKHQRKGISGDWQNYFNESMKDDFKEKFQSTLTATGYELDDSW
jgi:hypothetical protein